MEDLYGVKGDLFYLRNKEKKEVDFLVTINRKPMLLVEAQCSDLNFSPGLVHFHQFFLERKINPQIKSIQLISNYNDIKKNKQGITIFSASRYLEEIDFSTFIPKED